jgi:hypothetical protein
MGTCNEIEDYKDNPFDGRPTHPAPKMRFEMDTPELRESLKTNQQVKDAVETVEMFDKIPDDMPVTERNMYEKMIEESNGCGDDGLYGCKISPHLDLVRAQVLKKFKKEYKLDHVPTDVLIEEIRNRQLSEPLEGTVSVASNGTVAFSIDTLTWPAGVYNVQIVFVSQKEKHKEG